MGKAKGAIEKNNEPEPTRFGKEVKSRRVRLTELESSRSRRDLIRRNGKNGAARANVRGMNGESQDESDGMADGDQPWRRAKRSEQSRSPEGARDNQVLPFFYFANAK